MAPPDSTPQMLVLESLSENRWEMNRVAFSLDALATLPQRCYIFLDVINYPTTEGQRRKLLAHFNVPEFLANNTCFELNGYFGSKASYDDRLAPPAKHVTSYTTWFRCLLKMVKKVGKKDAHDEGEEYVEGTKKDYRWFEMSFFTRWDRSGLSQVLCVDIPPDFPPELQRLLQRRSEALDFGDPFAMHTNLVDQILVHADISVWRVRDPVRLLEKTRMRTGAIFGPIHEMSRHAIHTSEILEASIDTLKEMQHSRVAIHQKLHSDLGETYREQAKDYAQFQISLVKALKLRSDSNQERLKNEINLAFNSLARQDNSVMKSIALLTMIFLPATFISALFSTTFFNMSDEDGSWQVSDKLWVYWATTVPGTIVIVIVWRVWLAKSDPITLFFKERIKWFRTLPKSLTARNVRPQKGPEKAGQP